jgi:hypothetical protein
MVELRGSCLPHPGDDYGRLAALREEGASADAGLTMFVYTAEPGSTSEEALNLLASWSATLQQAPPN